MNVEYFEDQMRALRETQAQELLNLSYEDGTGPQHLAVSAPTTPPRLNTQLTEDNILNSRPFRRDGEHLKADKRKSVTYAPTVNLSPELAVNPTGINFTRAAGEQYASIYNAGMMLDERLDKEMRSKCFGTSSATFIAHDYPDAMKHLPTSDNDEYNGPYPNSYQSKFDSPSQHRPMILLPNSLGELELLSFPKGPLLAEALLIAYCLLHDLWQQLQGLPILLKVKPSMVAFPLPIHDLPLQWATRICLVILKGSMTMEMPHNSVQANCDDVCSRLHACNDSLNFSD
jgi:hypothetical protein